jgi:vacuolar-type H+-ATPase subunit C/Vma6
MMRKPRFIEGIIRGYRNGLLTGANYSNMTQCENIDGERHIWETVFAPPLC